MPPEDLRRAGDFVRQGDRFAEQGRWLEAQESFAMATKLAPKASLTWLSYALACFPQHRIGPAGNAIEDALHYAVPILDTPEIRKGLAAYEASNWTEAQRWFEAACANRPADDPAPRLLLALALLRQGKVPDALSLVVQAKYIEEAGAREADQHG
jgi:tetratricopeptide (TPR) repeat protein